MGNRRRSRTSTHRHVQYPQYSTAKLNKAKSFLNYHYPIWSKLDTPNEPSFFLRLNNGRNITLHCWRKYLSNHSLRQALQHPPIGGKRYWGPKEPMWTLVYQYPTDNNDGDIACRITTFQLHHGAYQWKQRKKEDCPRCKNTDGKLVHMFLECP